MVRLHLNQFVAKYDVTRFMSLLSYHLDPGPLDSPHNNSEMGHRMIGAHRATVQNVTAVCFRS